MATYFHILNYVNLFSSSAPTPLLFWQNIFEQTLRHRVNMLSRNRVRRRIAMMCPRGSVLLIDVPTMKSFLKSRRKLTGSRCACPLLSFLYYFTLLLEISCSPSLNLQKWFCNLYLYLSLFCNFATRCSDNKSIHQNFK